jgi:hypothetical protein
MPARERCPVCAHSVRVADGELVAHADPRWGRSGDCPGSGVGCKQDPRDAG